MIDWDMGQSAESLNSGRKTRVVTVNLPPPGLPAVTAGRSGVGRSTLAPARAGVYQASISAALSGLATIEVETRRLATRFRGRDIAGANRDLATLVETVRSLTLLTAEIGHAAGEDDARDDDYCPSPSICGMLGAVASAVESLLERHATQDWNATADSLEHELVPAFTGWKSVLAAFGTRSVS